MKKTANAANTNSVNNRFSRLVHGGTTEVANERLEWHDRVVFSAEASDIIYAIERQYSGRPDMLATLFYNEPRYWWVIAQHNNILDPFSELVTGRVIYVPSKERLATMLNGRQGGYPSKRETIPLIPPIII
jgi:hypothetical protein